MSKHEKHQGEAALLLANHKYTELANTDELIVWRCQQPGSSFYAFDITITRFGISVVGDIGFLGFQVGTAYGLPFLAGKDVGYYIHSKLFSSCRETEVDQEELYRFCLSNWGAVVRDCINDWVLDDSDRIGEVLAIIHRRGMVADWLDDGDLMATRFPSLIALSELFLVMQDVEQETEVFSYHPIHGNVEPLKIYESLISLSQATSVGDMAMIIADSPNGSCCPSEWQLTRPASRLMECLHLINYAAKQIMTQKDLNS